MKCSGTTIAQSGCAHGFFIISGWHGLSVAVQTHKSRTAALHGEGTLDFNVP